MATKVQDYRLVMDEDNLRAECHFPSISYDDFDRAGKLLGWDTLVSKSQVWGSYGVKCVKLLT